jgi:hypothetical protein
MAIVYFIVDHASFRHITTNLVVHRQFSSLSVDGNHLRACEYIITITTYWRLFVSTECYQHQWFLELSSFFFREVNNVTEAVFVLSDHLANSTRIELCCVHQRCCYCSIPYSMILNGN